MKRGGMVKLIFGAALCSTVLLTNSLAPAAEQRIDWHYASPGVHSRVARHHRTFAYENQDINGGRSDDDAYNRFPYTISGLNGI